MPDRATILAATPKCPVGPDHPSERHRAINVCGKPMAWDNDARIWFCAQHELVLAPSRLVSQQTNKMIFIETR